MPQKSKYMRPDHVSILFNTKILNLWKNKSICKINYDEYLSEKREEH